MPDDTLLEHIEAYTENDVLCGRGGGTNHHPGNNHWRALVAANKRLYFLLPKKQKVLVAKFIVHAVRFQQIPTGRFLQKVPTSHLWNDIGDHKATEKTSQALREGAPEIRRELAECRLSAGYAIGKTGYRENGSIALNLDCIKEVDESMGIFPQVPQAPSSNDQMMQAFQFFISLQQRQQCGTQLSHHQAQRPAITMQMSSLAQNPLSTPLVPDASATPSSQIFHTESYANDDVLLRVMPSAPSSTGADNTLQKEHPKITKHKSEIEIMKDDRAKNVSEFEFDQCTPTSKDLVLSKWKYCKGQ